MRRVFLASSAFIVLFFVMLKAIPSFSYEDHAMLRNSPFKDKKRAFALFSHDEHNEKAAIEECNVCHHLYQLGEKVEDESSEDMRCSDCHHVQRSYPTRPLMKAYHDLCKGCHLAKETGPIMCGECHPLK